MQILVYLVWDGPGEADAGVHAPHFASEDLGQHFYADLHRTVEFSKMFVSPYQKSSANVRLK